MTSNLSENSEITSELVQSPISLTLNPPNSDVTTQTEPLTERNDEKARERARRRNSSFSLPLQTESTSRRRSRLTPSESGRLKISSSTSFHTLSNDDLFFHQRLRYIQTELDNLLMPQTPRGSLSDKTGTLKLSIECIVNEAVDRALEQQHQEYQKRFEELFQRISYLEEKLGTEKSGTEKSGWDAKTPKASLLKDKLLKKRGKSPIRDKATPSSSTQPVTLGLSVPSFAVSRSRSPSASASIDTKPLNYSLSSQGRTEELFKEAALLKAQQKRPTDDHNPLFNVFDHPDLFQYELGYGTVYRTLLECTSDRSLIDTHLDENFYLAHFFGLPQTHYYVPDDHSNAVGPVIITVLDIPKGEALGLVRSQLGDKRIKLTETNRKKRILELYSQAGLPLETKIYSLDDELLTRRLISLEHESINEHRQYKFGILLAHDHQTEDEMFANESTPAFERFLSFLGARIELQGWKKYRAGLDTKSGTTGTHSLYQLYENHQVMFHVSTMLPKEPPGSQQLERKRHLGNDVCLIIFHDGVEPFDPTLIHSHFNYCFLVVREVPCPENLVIPPEEYPSFQLFHTPKSTERVFYKFGLAVKKDAPLRKMTPYLPSPPIMPNTIDTLQFLLVKLINAERATMHAPEFRDRSARTRRLLLSSIIEEFCKGKGIVIK